MGVNILGGPSWNWPAWQAFFDVGVRHGWEPAGTTCTGFRQVAAYRVRARTLGRGLGLGDAGATCSLRYNRGSLPLTPADGCLTLA